MDYEWLPMSNELHDSLFWWYKNRPVKNATYVFVVPDKHQKNYGKPYTVRRWILKVICKRAGVKEFHYHALRRFVASVLADTHKVSSKTIQRILRHKYLHTTELYIKNLNSDLSVTMNLLSEIKVPQGSTPNEEWLVINNN
jgi:integrase